MHETDRQTDPKSLLYRPSAMNAAVAYSKLTERLALAVGADIDILSGEGGGAAGAMKNCENRDF